MREKFMAQVRFEKLCKAQKQAKEDPRVKELQEKIDELKKQKDELIEKISDDIFKEMTKGS